MTDKNDTFNSSSPYMQWVTSARVIPQAEPAPLSPSKEITHSWSPDLCHWEGLTFIINKYWFNKYIRPKPKGDRGLWAMEQDGALCASLGICQEIRITESQKGLC